MAVAMIAVPFIGAAAPLAHTAISCLCMCCAHFGEHGLDVSPNWWRRSLQISVANTVSNGVYWVPISSCLHRSVSGGWWPGVLDVCMAGECCCLSFWCCACAKNCAIPGRPAELFLGLSSTADCFLL